jgi:L-asparaginase / beta-aspartyl-peptidase
MPDWAIAVHGGAKHIARAEERAHREGCKAALAKGAGVLAAGGSATAAVEAAIRVLEADKTFNAGRGSARASDGTVAMDAALMDGRSLDVGAVAGVSGLLHPISAAAALLSHEEILLIGSPAREFAIQNGVEQWDAGSEKPSGNKGHDTVGCVALDQSGHFAAGTSTGGLDGHAPGRIGDSPMPGAGFYADDRVGAISCSGDGEHIARSIFAARVIIALSSRSPPDPALNQALPEIERLHGEIGAILLDRAGRWAWTHNSDNFAVGYASSEEPDGRVFLRKQEDGEWREAQRPARVLDHHRGT